MIFIFLQEKGKMRKLINNGEINFKKNKIIIGNSLVSKISGFIMLSVIAGVAIALAFIGVRGSQWWSIFKSSWYLVGIMLWLGARYIGGWSHSMIIDKEKKKISVIKRWMFYPYAVKEYLFDDIKSVIWEEASSDRKIVLETKLVEVTIELVNNEWVSVGGVSYPQPGKSVQEGKEISTRIADFIGVESRELRRKKNE